MSDHISEPQMEKFYARTLEVPELTRIAGHLATCAHCRQAFHEVFQQRRDYAPVAFNLSPEAWLKNEHLTYEQLAPYVEERMDEIEHEMLDIHLKSCARCREDLRKFIDHRQQTEPEMQVRYAPRERASWRENLLPLWQRFLVGWRPMYAAAIVAAVAGVAILTAVFLGQHRMSDSSPAQQAQSTRPTDAPPTTSSHAAVPPLPAPPVDETAQSSADDSPKTAIANRGPARSTVREPRTPQGTSTSGATKSSPEALVSLHDSGVEIALNNSGELTGLENLLPETEQAIREVLLARVLGRPQTLLEVTGSSSALRGARGGESRFRLISPKRTVLAEDRPAFRWEPLKEATSYRVHVVDSNNHEVARSPELPSTTTEWAPSVPLKRGIVYMWIVTAEVNGEEVTSPAASEPEMRFKVLEAEKLNELNRLRERSSLHLVRGVWYARAGMLGDAEREFQLLVKDNPQSPLARKLLNDVRSWR